MRNLNEYPVTHDEIVECLRDFQIEVNPLVTGLIGDMRPLLLEAAISHVLSNERVSIRQDGKVATIADLDDEQRLRPLGS